eukprot:236536_1
MLHSSDPEISGQEDEENSLLTEDSPSPSPRSNLLVHRNVNRDDHDGDESHTEPSLNQKEELKRHEAILQESKSTVTYFIVCALFTSFLRSSRTNVWILYARVFYLETSTNIAWVLYGGTMFSGISALFYSSVADYIGYDKMMVILLLLKCIGVLLECIGIDFSLLIIGYLLTSLAILYVCLSYISWILPHKHAVLYTSYFYAAYFLSYLSGAMIGSILSYYFNYRLIFWVNFGFMASIFVFSLYFISGIQKRLEAKQLTFKRLYKSIPLRLEASQHQQNTFENRDREETNIQNREYQSIPTEENDDDDDDA